MRGASAVRTENSSTGTPPRFALSNCFSGSVGSVVAAAGAASSAPTATEDEDEDEEEAAEEEEEEAEGRST